MTMLLFSLFAVVGTLAVAALRYVAEYLAYRRTVRRRLRGLS